MDIINFRSPPDSKVHRANMGSIWGRQDPGGPHVGPMNIAIWAVLLAWVNFNPMMENELHPS